MIIGKVTMRNRALYLVCALLMVLLGISDTLRGVFTPLFTEVYGFSMSQIGLIVSISYLGNLACLLCGGFILDKIGRKKAIAAFALALALSELLLLGGREYLILAVGFFLALGISTLLNTAINLISDSFSSTRSLMLLNALFFIQGIGTSGSQLIFSRFSASTAAWNAVLISIAVLLVPIAIVVSRMKIEAAPESDVCHKDKGHGSIRTMVLVLITLSLGFYMIAEHGITNYLIMYGTGYLGISAASAGLSLSLFSAGIMTGRLLLGNLADRIGAEKMILASLILSAGLSSLAFGTAFLPLLFLVGFSASIVYPTTVSVIRRYVPDSLGARATTVAVSAASILDIIFNAVFGHAIDVSGYGFSMPVLCIAFGTAAVLMIPAIISGRS